MPTYDYECAGCGRGFSAFHALNASVPPCPTCHVDEVYRVLLSAPAYHDSTARGREAAMRSLPECGKGCRCCP